MASLECPCVTGMAHGRVTLGLKVEDTLCQLGTGKRYRRIGSKGREWLRTWCEALRSDGQVYWRSLAGSVW